MDKTPNKNPVWQYISRDNNPETCQAGRLSILRRFGVLYQPVNRTNWCFKSFLQQCIFTDPPLTTWSNSGRFRRKLFWRIRGRGWRRVGMASNFWLARTQDWWVLQSFSFALPEPMGSTPNHDGCKGRFCGGNPTWNSPSDHRKVAGSPSKGRQRTDMRVLCESWRLINEPYFLSLSWTHQMHPNAFRWHHLWLCPRSKSEILCSKQAPHHAQRVRS